MRVFNLLYDVMRSSPKNKAKFLFKTNIMTGPLRFETLVTFITDDMVILSEIARYSDMSTMIVNHVVCVAV